MKINPAISTTLLVSLIGIAKSKYGNTNYSAADLQCWTNWSQIDFETACLEVIDDALKYQGYLNQEANSWLVNKEWDKYNLIKNGLWKLYPIARYALSYKDISGESLKLARRVNSYRTWGMKNIENLFKAFNVPSIIRNMRYSQNKQVSNTESQSNHEASVYTLGPFEIHNIANLASDKKDRFDNIMKKLLEIGSNTTMPFFNQALQGLTVMYSNSMAQKLLGSYNDHSQIIQIKTFTQREYPDDKYLSTLIHEVAHRIDYRLLSEKQQNDINDLYENMILERNTNLSNWNIRGTDLGFKFDNHHIEENAHFERIDSDGYIIVYYPSNPSHLIHTGYKKRAFYNRLVKWSKNKFPTIYSMKDAKEFFAEMVKYYMTNQYIHPEIRIKFESIIQKPEKQGSANRSNIECYFTKIDNHYKINLMSNQKEIWIPSSLVTVERIDQSFHVNNEKQGVISVPSWVKAKIDNGTFVSYKPRPKQLSINGKEVAWIHCRYKITKNSILCDGNWIPRRLVHKTEPSSTNTSPRLGSHYDWSIDGKILVDKWVADKIKAGKWGN